MYNLDSIFALPPVEFDRFKKAWAESHRKRRPFSEPHPSSARLNWPAPIGKRSRTKDLNTALTMVTQQIRTAVNDGFANGGDAWKVLLEILSRLDVLPFVGHLGEELAKWIRTGSAPKCAFDLLYCSEDKAQKPLKTPVQFEPEGVFDAPIYSLTGQQWLTRVRLNFAGQKAQSAAGQKKRSKRSPALPLPPVWGTEAGCAETFSAADSPIGQISFFNKDVCEKPTSVRYDRDLWIFPVGTDKRTELISAMKWLWHEDRKGKTWAIRSKPKKDGVFLLLTYLDEKVDAPAHLAELFAGPAREESDRAIVQFETVCTGVVDALDGIPSLTDHAKVNLFALHKPDPGRTQVYCSESFTAAVLKRLAQAWQADSRKHPPILLPQFPLRSKQEAKQQEEAGIKARPKAFEPSVPFPYQAVECLNTIWQKCETANEAKADAAADLDLSDAFELLRRTGHRPMDVDYLGRILELAVRRARPLLTAVGQAMHQTNRITFVAMGDRGRHSSKSVLHARRWPCILSLLLTRLGYDLNTPTTMKETAFLIGRFLAQLDRLHAYYAKYVSDKNEGLRQLLGNSLMSVALESPLRAFELAGQRMLPYQAWAEQFSHGRDSFKEEQKRKDAGSVGAILWDLGRIAEELSERGIPEAARGCLPQRQGHEAKQPTKRILDLADTLKAQDRAWMHADSAAKAQMLLGYLARPPKKVSNTPGAPASEAPTELPDFDDAVSEPRSTI
ncbi:MAG: hypothetical protein KA191_00655 [Verrucomicrobia bacterium]|nr:hypothetical protein [Verrucomicrobiota bacterium]